MTHQKDPARTEIGHLHRFADLAGKRVLEIGCGDGRLTWQYARETRGLTSIDLDRDRLRVALIDRPSDLDVRATFCQADSIYLPFSKEQFDIAILAWSF